MLLYTRYASIFRFLLSAVGRYTRLGQCVTSSRSDRNTACRDNIDAKNVNWFNDVYKTPVTPISDERM